ncbi:hypothetical protein C8A05DRAFT_34439 [Staphylotrichum tortipilum]|uniref:Uncharacterized protein n=1 Tax=Staphylotrichum tortipilum TaxID=2831512 RepID=A0AAN6MJU0_9PEZI|nr:hypothetical protein C8A05DRAFT_34439 [Staphylotrichum longicolle]
MRPMRTTTPVGSLRAAQINVAALRDGAEAGHWGLFAGICLGELEAEVVGLVVDASRKGLDDDEDSAWEQRRRWEEVLGPIEPKLHDLMDGWVARMLGSVVGRLLNPDVKLRRDRQDNNCQMFCDALIDYSLYRSLVPATKRCSPPGTTAEGVPPYLVSLVCHADGYRRERRVQTKHDVPSGLCEEYLLKFRFGFHLGSDIIDTLHEYWHDGGNFGSPLYPHQRLFSRDCTEAYGRSPVRCGDCNTAKHASEFPFDSWSTAELHLTRGAVIAGRLDGQPPGCLLVQGALVAGAGTMASSAGFQKETAWLAVNEDRRLDWLKLGGIHRAQPINHQWEEGKYHEYFIADWAHMQLGDKVAEYERQRELRRALPDAEVGSGRGVMGMWMMAVIG